MLCLFELLPHYIKSVNEASVLIADTIPAWSERRGSNPRPSDWKSETLPTELRSHSNQFSKEQYGADGGNRTRDLILTKDVLYRLSYVSLLKSSSVSGILFYPIIYLCHYHSSSGCSPPRIIRVAPSVVQSSANSPTLSSGVPTFLRLTSAIGRTGYLFMEPRVGLEPTTC